MSQTFALPAGTDYVNQYLAGGLNSNLEALRSSFSGASAPTSPSPVPGQLWADTSTGFLMVRNAANNGWTRVAPLSASVVVQLAAEGWAGTLSASKTDWIGSVPRVGTIRRLVMVSAAATTSSSGNEWQFQLRKYPAAAPGSPVDLFSGTVGTHTQVEGVGGGVEFVADAAYVLTPDQNAGVLDLDQLELVVTKAGTVANLTQFRALVEMD